MTIDMAETIRKVKGLLYDEALDQARIFLPNGREATNSFEFELGGKARLENFRLSNNPYQAESVSSARWNLGWIIMNGYLFSGEPQ